MEEVYAVIHIPNTEIKVWKAWVPLGLRLAFWLCWQMNHLDIQEEKNFSSYANLLAIEFNHDVQDDDDVKDDDK